MSYTYPEALDAMERVVRELLATAGHPRTTVHVLPDAHSGTASVDWTWDGLTLKEVKMYLPVLPAGTRISVKEFTDYAGYATHEVYHPLKTSKQTWDLACKTGRNALLNALEDVRIEKCAIEERVVPNALTVLGDLVRSLDYACDKPSFDPNDPTKIGFVMGFLGRAANGYDMDPSIVTRKLRPNSAVSKVLKWALPELAQCLSTQACLALADRIVAALPAKVKIDPPKQGKAQQGQQGEQGEQGERGEQGVKAQQAEQAEQADEQQARQGGESAPAGTVGQEKAENGEGKASRGASGAEKETGKLAPQNVDPVDLRPGQHKALDKGVNPEAVNGEVMTIKAIREAAKHARTHVPMIDDSGETFASAQTAREAARASRQRALLARALRAEDIDGFDGGMRTGLFDVRAVARVAAGERAVFGRRTLVEGYETDVAVIVDGSGSMSLNDKINRASSMALVIAQAAAQVGVACSTYMFGAVCRNGPYELVTVKEGKGKPGITAFGSMPLCFGGDTELCRTMVMVSAKQAMRAPHKRRVMFVVSDGMCTLGHKALKGVASYLEANAGVELAFLSIGAPLKGCFRNEVHVDSQGDIAGVGLGLLTRTLARGLEAA